MTECGVINMKNLSAFTLAEVLITLGIIGVVAALTLPSLVGNYKRKVTENKVKKFYSVMSQATGRAIAENGSMEYWDGFSSHHNGKEMQQWFNKYLKPYLNITDEWIDKDEESGNESLFIVMSDGGIVLFTNWAGSSPDIDDETGEDQNNSKDYYNGLIHVAYLTNAKAIKKEDRKSCVNAFSFLFYSPLKKQYYFQPYAYQADTPEKYKRDFFLKQIKSGNTQYCTALMMMDGWEIKDDYPFGYKY